MARLFRGGQARMGYLRNARTEAGGGVGLDARDPRLVSINEQRREAKVRDELSGETGRRERGKVSLPALKFMREED